VERTAGRGVPGIHEPAFEHGAIVRRERRHHERPRLRRGGVTHREPLHERRGIAVGAEHAAERGGIGERVGARGRVAVEQRGVAARAAVAGAGGALVEQQGLHLAGEAGHEVGGQVGGPRGRRQGRADRHGEEEPG
jgi:hypothetical protein